MGKMDFVDGEGRNWHCRVDYPAIRRGRQEGIDLSLVEEHLGDFYRGSPKLADALWAVVGPQAKDKGVSREDFENQLRGEVLEKALAALLEGLEDFFPPRRAKLFAVAEADVRKQLDSLLTSTSASTE